MSPAVKNGLLIAVLLIVVIAAGFFFTRESEDSVIPETGIEYTFMCDETGDKFTISAREYDTWVRDPAKRHIDTETGRMTFLNPNTGKFTVVPAEVHKPTNTWYITQDSKGKELGMPKEVEEYELEQAKKAAGG